MNRNARPRRRGIGGAGVVVILLLTTGLFGTTTSFAKDSVDDLVAELDRRLAAIWSEAFTQPAPPASDEILLRRLSIDLRGVIPTADETRLFLADQSADRWAKWTLALLETPDHAERFAEVWEQILIGRKGDADGLDREGFRRWLRRAFLTNKPYDELAREILLATGEPEDAPGVNFFLRFETKPEDLAGRVSRVFLGTRIECAQCHDHPYADVKREEFYGFAAFFARTDAYRVYDKAGGNTDRRGVRDRDDGEIEMPPMKQGAKEESIAPLFFGERFTEASYVREKDAEDATRSGRGSSTQQSMRRDDRDRSSRSRSRAGDRRVELVKWLTGSKNPYFARAVVNRIVAHFLGKGFVNPVDDFTEDSRIVLPQLLEFLVDDFVSNGYDLRRLIRIVTGTRAYAQRSAQAVPGGIAPGEDHDLFASMPIRPLEAEELARSVLRASGLEEPQPEENARQVRAYVEQARRDFDRRFGVDEDEKRMEFQGTVLQVLLMFNGSFTAGRAPASRPFQAEYEKKYPGNLAVVLHGVPPARHIEHLFLSTLSRPPNGTERQIFEEHLVVARDDAARRSALADVQWALLNSAEFLHRN